MLVKVTRGYQLTIPSQLRCGDELQVGEYVDVIRDKQGRYIIEPIEIRKKNSTDEVIQYLKETENEIPNEIRELSDEQKIELAVDMTHEKDNH